MSLLFWGLGNREKHHLGTLAAILQAVPRTAYLGGQLTGAELRPFRSEQWRMLMNSTPRITPLWWGVAIQMGGSYHLTVYIIHLWVCYDGSIENSEWEWFHMEIQPTWILRWVLTAHNRLFPLCTLTLADTWWPKSARIPVAGLGWIGQVLLPGSFHNQVPWLLRSSNQSLQVRSRTKNWSWKPHRVVFLHVSSSKVRSN